VLVSHAKRERERERERELGNDTSIMRDDVAREIQPSHIKR